MMPMNDVVDITVKLSFKEYLRFCYYAYFKSLVVKILIVIWLMCIFFLVDGIYRKFALDIDFSADPASLGVIFIMPFFFVKLYFSAKKIYRTSAIGEVVNYKINNEVISSKGETFEYSFAWDRVCKMSETRSWILLWQSKNVANIIPKADLSANDLIVLKRLVADHPSVINKLKKG